MVLEKESKNLTNQWQNLTSLQLKDYLVVGRQNPQFNLQSILKRHFLIEKLFGKTFHGLQKEEIAYCVQMQTLMDAYEPYMVPDVKKPLFKDLFLEGLIPQDKKNLLEAKWKMILDQQKLSVSLDVLEPACGSANDYRFFHSFGLSRFLHYRGIDICEKNIQNANKWFQTRKINASFKQGNVFHLEVKKDACDYLVLSDLLEHFSLQAIEKTLDVFCSITRKEIFLNFFNMGDIKEHKMIPKGNYYWNELSIFQMKAAFEKRGFKVQAIGIDAFLKKHGNYHGAENKKAYSFVVSKKN